MSDNVKQLKKTDSVLMNEVEKLKFVNVQLQKNILHMQTKELERQELDIVAKIRDRTSVDITGWNINLDTGVCTPRDNNGLQ